MILPIFHYLRNDVVKNNKHEDLMRRMGIFLGIDICVAKRIYENNKKCQSSTQPSDLLILLIKPGCVIVIWPAEIAIILV